MALITNPALDKTQSEKKTDGIYTATAMLNKPQKVSNRPVEAVPRQMGQQPVATASTDPVNYAKSQATLGTVQNNATVQGQLDSILSSGSPLLSRARADSNAQYAERGLNNSSMGVQAGEEAVIRQALPIAQQDAQTYANQDLENQRSVNQFGETGLNQEFTALNQKNQNEFTAGESALDRDYKTTERIAAEDYNTKERVATQDFSNQQRVATQDYSTAERLGQQQFQSAESQAQSDRSLAANKELADQNFLNQKALAELDAQQKLAMNDIQNLYSREITASQMGAQLFQNHQNAVATVMGNSSLSASQAQATISVLNQSLKDALKLSSAMNGIDMSQYVNSVTVEDSKGGVGGTDLNVIPDTPEAIAAANKKQAWYDEEVKLFVGGVPVKVTRKYAIERGWLKEEYKP